MKTHDLGDQNRFNRRIIQRVQRCESSSWLIYRKPLCFVGFCSIILNGSSRVILKHNTALIQSDLARSEGYQEIDEVCGVKLTLWSLTLLMSYVNPWSWDWQQTEWSEDWMLRVQSNYQISMLERNRDVMLAGPGYHECRPRATMTGNMCTAACSMPSTPHQSEIGRVDFLLSVGKDRRVPRRFGVS